MENEHSAVMITVPDEKRAQEIASELLKQNLVACVNIIGPIKSMYTWEDKINEDSEYLMICKTQNNLAINHLPDKVKEIHPYEVPEVIVLPITGGYLPYLDWIRHVTRAN